MLYVHKFTDNKPIDTTGFWVGKHVCHNTTTKEVKIVGIGTENIRLMASVNANKPNTLNIYTTSKYHPLVGNPTGGKLALSVNTNGEFTCNLIGTMADADTLQMSLSLS